MPPAKPVSQVALESLRAELCDLFMRMIRNQEMICDTLDVLDARITQMEKDNYDDPR